MGLGTTGPSFEEILVNQLSNLGSVKKEATITEPKEQFDIAGLLQVLMMMLGNKNFTDLIGGLFSKDTPTTTETLGFTPAGQQTTSWGELGF